MRAITTTPSDLDPSASPAWWGRRREGRGLRPLLAALIATALASLVLAIPGPVAGASVSVSTPRTDVGLIPDWTDVFTPNFEGALIPVDPTSTPASAPLFNLAGNALNVTWGQWSSVSAKSLASTVTDNAVSHTGFLIGMNGLVPNGVYSLFYRSFSPNSANPSCGVDPLVALPAALPQLQRPDPDSFVASRSGNGLFLASVPRNLLAAQGLEIVLVYHFDGHTYGPVPTRGEVTNNCLASFGVDAMRQLLIIQTPI